MSTSHICPIWGTSAERQFYAGMYAFESPRAGGAYLIDMDALDRVQSLVDEAKARLTTMLADQRRQGVIAPLVTRETLGYALSRAPLPVYERAIRLLKHLTDSIPLGTSAAIDCSGNTPLIVSESVDEAEVRALLDYLEGSGWMRCQRYIGGNPRCEITVDGYRRIEEIQVQVDSAQAFVAIWFNDEMNDAYKVGIEQAITNAGYRSYRVDQEMVQNPGEGKIDDTIIAEIRRSRFVVADFTHGDTGIRGSVYYEAGFAHGLGIPVIYSCRQDQIEKVHFDTRQYYHIPWGNPEELRVGLEKRILAMVGEGPLKNS